MGEKEMREMFEWAGLSTIYDQHGYKMWLSGLEDSIDAELLDHFADAYSFENAEMYYDEFLFHLRIFKNIIKNNELPPRYW
ncbi:MULTISPECIES: hypothetical protein [Bacillaceae]|jgi:hypothetical protein|uniref:hypothetical protein n=1 Tax=Bacillaceae TaxID=186817 RepID=UPI0011A6092B|nr:MULTISPECIES: hypothetical protein [Bacillaceae]MCM3121926.1 hypothetical protein [Mesobacillus sp. MER 33]MCM3231890.1 hypothetical protein [Mesobacillus sp. MER 48]